MLNEKRIDHTLKTTPILTSLQPIRSTSVIPEEEPISINDEE
jgi:hypothetical protein